MAYVLSSVSGNLISAASAGYAPTNSGDVSAIASAYQVVSATATQLYAGTAYVTSINEAPVSAARAGNAANASLANSAWYDGTGRLISALPDSAAVSAIASSYVESGVSSKQDTLSFAYNTADQISSINGSALGGMDEAAVSGIASAYAESAASSKADSTALTSYALSADVSGTVDLVSSQSANWGGSALALSAGPGVTLTKSGDTLIASTDETVLFSGSNSGMVATNLTEPLSGFNSFKICFNPFGNGMSREWKEFSWAGSSDVYTVATFHKNGSDNLAWYVAFQPNTSGTTLTPIANKLWILGSTTVQDRDQMKVYRVVGINRTAEA